MKYVEFVLLALLSKVSALSYTGHLHGGSFLQHQQSLLPHLEASRKPLWITALLSTKEFDVQPGGHIHSQGHPDANLEAATPSIINEEEIEGDHGLSTVHGVASRVIVPCALVFLLSLAVSQVITMSSYTKWIPESAAILATAMLLGNTARLMIDAGIIKHEGLTLGASTILNLAFLPIIIFASGWGLRRADFIYQFTPIMIFAVFGTLISTVVVGFASYKAAQLGWHAVTDFRSNMVFAALISAVDPVATLVTYKALAVEPLLNIMVFGESTINDAVAVVLFSIINERWHDLSYSRAIWRITMLLFGSMVFAWLVSVILLLLMRVTKMRRDTHIAILFIWITPFFVYAAAEATGQFSGIIATLVSGIVFGTYGRLHLEGEGAQEADNFFELTAGLADKAVFMLCGACTAMITSHKGYLFGGCAIVICLIARICSVVPCGLLANAYKRCAGDTHLLTGKHLFMMCHGGLRGGIALVLALEIDATWCSFKATILNGTFIVICTLLLFCGGTTEFFLRKLKIPMGDQVDWSCLSPENKSSLIAGLESFDESVTQVVTSGVEKSQSRLLVNEEGRAR